jgi:hypothetical protein
MTNPSPDWLDNVLRSRPVDDEGFSARVVGLGRGETRTWWTVRIVVAAVVLVFVGACSSVELALLGLLFSGEGGVDGKAWLDEHRVDFARVVARFDAEPALRRRSGRNAGPVLDAAIARFGDERRLSAADREACRDEVRSKWAAYQRLPMSIDDTHPDRAHSRCDTSWITGLAAYDEWRSPTAENVDWELLATMARTHLRRAAAEPVVAGAPAPFVVAARDVEALGRLALTHTGQGAYFFGVVAREHQQAARDGRAGDHVVVVEEAEAKVLLRAWWAGLAFISASASDDDVAGIGRLQSVLACGALGDAFGQFGDGGLDAQFLDAHRVQRVRALDRRGCAQHPAQPVEQVCGRDLSPGFCRLVLAPAVLPPFRQKIIRVLELIYMPDFALDLPSSTKTEQR